MARLRLACRNDNGAVSMGSAVGLRARSLRALLKARAFGMTQGGVGLRVGMTRGAWER